MRPHSLLTLATALFLLAARPLPAAEPARPHLVLFLSDDHSLLDSTVYGSHDVRTPNMQRLAADGLTFDRAFVASPSCAPSRAALLTGLMPARNGAEPNHSRPRADLKKLPAYLQSLGYEVVAFGKVSHYKHTAAYGFDFFAHDAYHEDIAVSAAIKWLRARQNPKPLCLIVGTNWPHVPWPKDPEGHDPATLAIPAPHIDTPQTRDARARYYAAIGRMDTELGEVYDAAREVLGAANTVFLHTSDHGAQWPFGKWNLYDAGIRTPLIAVWPGHIRAGARTDAMVSWIDLLPTLVELAGGPAPTGLDGRSFAPVLRGETTRHRDRIFTTHSGDGSFNVYPIRSVRTADWKYIRNLHPEFKFTSHVDLAQAADGPGYFGSWLEAARTDPAAATKVQRYYQRPAEELYDLRADPLELRNLASAPAHAARLATLRDDVTAWMKEQGDTSRLYGEPKLLAPAPIAAPAAKSATAAPRPNLVYILADDLGYHDCGFRGGQDIPTPHLDRLAASGAILDQFYAQPVCSPTRAALLTGRYPFRYGLQVGVVRPYARYGLSLAERTLPTALREAGYATAIVGKWHLGHFAPAYLPTARGFDHQYGHYNGALDYFTHERDGGHDWHRDDQPSYDEGYSTRLVGRESARLIRERDRTKPLFLYVPFNAVHSPLQAPPETLATLARLTPPRRTYAAMLAELDHAVGEIVAALESENILGETLLVFSSDNGGPRPGVVTDNTPLRAGKHTLYEGGVRVAAFATWPGRIPAGTTVRAPLHMVDWYPTFLALAGAPLAQSLPLDGRDLLACLTAGAPSPHDVIVLNTTPDTGALREGRWKLIRNGQFIETDEEPAAAPGQPKGKAAARAKKTVRDSGTDTFELFDLETDLGEKNNVAAAHPEIVARLRARLAEFAATAARPLSTPGDNRGTAPKIWGQPDAAPATR